LAVLEDLQTFVREFDLGVFTNPNSPQQFLQALMIGFFMIAIVAVAVAAIRRLM
jgi:hypothetical protein